MCLENMFEKSLKFFNVEKMAKKINKNGNW